MYTPLGKVVDIGKIAVGANFVQVVRFNHVRQHYHYDCCSPSFLVSYIVTRTHTHASHHTAVVKLAVKVVSVCNHY